MGNAENTMDKKQKGRRKMWSEPSLVDLGRKKFLRLINASSASPSICKMIGRSRTPSHEKVSSDNEKFTTMKTRTDVRRVE